MHLVRLGLRIRFRHWQQGPPLLFVVAELHGSSGPLMASVAQERGRWRAWVRRKNQPRLCRSFRTKKEAEVWAAKIEREIEAGNRMDDSRRTLAHAIDAYLQTDAADNLTAHERNVIAWWRKQMGPRRLQELKRSDFYAARERMRRRDGARLAPATRNRRTAAISAVLTYATDKLEWIAVNPARIEHLEENNKRERLLDADERARLLAACQSSPELDLPVMVICAMVSGARAGELVGLTWRHLDLDTGVAHLAKTKTKVRRPIPLRGRALEELLALAERHAGAAPDDHVFRHIDGTAPFQYGRAWRAARAAAGIKDLRFHDLRHLAASELAMAGTSSRELQHLLGHSNANMTARYSHFTVERTLELGDRLSDRLFPVSPA